MTTFTESQIALQNHIEAQNAKTQAWIDEDPQNRWAGITVSDPEHWAEYNIFTVEQYEHYQLKMAVWEMYKDVHGFRPRHMGLSEMTTEELEAEIESLQRTVEAERKWEAERRAEARRAERETIKAFIAAGAPNEKVVRRWMRQANGSPR